MQNEKKAKIKFSILILLLREGGGKKDCLVYDCLVCTKELLRNVHL